MHAYSRSTANDVRRVGRHARRDVRHIGRPFAAIRRVRSVRRVRRRKRIGAPGIEGHARDGGSIHVRFVHVRIDPVVVEIRRIVGRRADGDSRGALAENPHPVVLVQLAILRAVRIKMRESLSATPPMIA